MTSFLINAVPNTSPMDFFRSGNYDSDSYSKSWTTRTVPDSEGLNTPVYVLVLQKFDIPFTGGPPGGTLPGIDIKRMPAIDAIKLSLAESLMENQWWDMFEDGEGGVYFQLVFDGSGPSKFIELDIRLCVPSVDKSNDVDMVVVHGYEPPPVREIRDFKNVVPLGLGTINPESVDGTETLFTVSPADLLSSTCHARMASPTVYKSYRDPVFTDNEFNPQEPHPFFDPTANESLIAYVHKITGLPTNPDQATRVQFSLQSHTPWYLPVVFPSLTMTTEPACAGPGVVVADSIKYVEGTFSYTSPDFADRYGTPWPLVIKPSGLYFTGNRLVTLLNYGSLGSVSADLLPTNNVLAFAEPIKELKSVDSGANWFYTITGRGQYDISIYFQLKGLAEEVLWEAVLESIGQPATIKYTDGSPFATSKLSVYGSSTASLNVLGGPGDLGYIVDGMWLALDLERPCAVITDQEGEPLTWAQSLRVDYAPIVLITDPAPIAYYSAEGSGIVDQNEGKQDSDPTTLQNFDESPMEQLQDRMQGNIIDVTLPFCGTGEECLTVARTIYNYMHHTGVKTYVLTCGPNDEPELGAGVQGYPADVVIDSIEYAYSDSSSYTITVNLAPIFATVGSWNNGAWMKRTETVSRPGIIRWVGGDGVNYRVEVKGLGIYNAINSTDAVFYPGEVVTVQINNNPVEE